VSLFIFGFTQVLRPHDVITAFDGVDISNDGTVAFREGERICFSYLISQVKTLLLVSLKL
jgi:hypothetical protein